MTRHTAPSRPQVKSCWASTNREARRKVWETETGLRRNGTIMRKTITTVTDPLAPAAKSVFGQKRNKCWEKGCDGMLMRDELGAERILSCSDEAFVVVTPTGKTQGYTVSSKVGLGAERFGPQSLQDVLRCLAEHTVQLTLHLISFFSALLLMSLSRSMNTMSIPHHGRLTMKIHLKEIKIKPHKK